MKNVFTPRNKEFFECDCYDKDHLIRAEYEIDEWTPKDGITRKFHELNITFTCNLADYDNVYGKDNRFIQSFDRFIWRIKNAFKILQTGEIKTEGYFSPCRSWIDTKNNPVEGEFGYETTKNLATFLNVTADKIKAGYDEDLKEYQESQQKAKENLNKSTGTIETA